MRKRSKKRSLSFRESEEVTDHYLADLATLHGIRLVTLDQNLAHPSVDVIL